MIVWKKLSVSTSVLQLILFPTIFCREDCDSVRKLSCRKLCHNFASSPVHCDCLSVVTCQASVREPSTWRTACCSVRPPASSSGRLPGSTWPCATCTDPRWVLFAVPELWQQVLLLVEETLGWTPRVKSKVEVSEQHCGQSWSNSLLEEERRFAASDLTFRRGTFIYERKGEMLSVSQGRGAASIIRLHCVLRSCRRSCFFFSVLNIDSDSNRADQSCSCCCCVQGAGVEIYPGSVCSLVSNGIHHCKDGILIKVRRHSDTN